MDNGPTPLSAPVKDSDFSAFSTQDRTEERNLPHLRKEAGHPYKEADHTFFHNRSQQTRLQPTHTQAEPENKISNKEENKRNTPNKCAQGSRSTYCNCTLWTNHFAAQRHDITDTRNVCIDADCFIKCPGLVTGIVGNGNLSRLTRQDWFFGERGFGTGAGGFGT